MKTLAPRALTAKTVFAPHLPPEEIEHHNVVYSKRREEGGAYDQHLLCQPLGVSELHSRITSVL